MNPIQLQIFPTQLVTQCAGAIFLVFLSNFLVL